MRFPLPHKVLPVVWIIGALALSFYLGSVYGEGHAFDRVKHLLCKPGITSLDSVYVPPNHVDPTIGELRKKNPRRNHLNPEPTDTIRI